MACFYSLVLTTRCCVTPGVKQGAKPIKLPFHFSKGCVCLWFCPIILLLLLHIGSLGLFIAMPDYCYAHAYMLHGPAVGHYMVVYGPVLGWFGLNFLVVFLIWMFCCKAPPKAVTQQAPPPAQVSRRPFHLSLSGSVCVCVQVRTCACVSGLCVRRTCCTCLFMHM